MPLAHIKEKEVYIMTKYKIRQYHTKGKNKGNLKNEFFFDNKENALNIYNCLYSNNLKAYNPTFWEYDENKKDYFRVSINQW